MLLSIAVSPADANRVLAGTPTGAYLSTDGATTWTAIASLPATTIGDFLFDPASPQTVYAAGSGGTLAKSTDGGSTWNAIGSDVASQLPLALAIDPTHTSTVYAGTLNNGVYKSADGGASWTAQNSGLTNLHVSALVVDPTTPSNVYAGTLNGGPFKSTDGGATWSAFAFGVIGTNVAGLAADSAGTIYLGNLTGTYETALGGLTWTPLNTTEQYVNAVAVGPGSPGRLFIGSGLLPFRLGDVLFADDRATFHFATGINGIDVVSLAVDSFAPTHVLAACIGVTLLSEDSGTTWNAVDAPRLPTDVAFDDNEQGVAYLTGTGGVAKSIDGGQTWGDASNGLPVTVVRAVLPVPGTNGVVLTGTAVGIYGSNDGGADWSPQVGLTTVVWTLAPGASGKLWAGADDGPYLSTDGGGHWAHSGNLSSPVHAFLSTASGRLYAGTGAGLFASSDNGSTWNPVSGGLPANLDVHALIEDPSRGAVVVGAFPGVYESTDGGATWSASGSGLTNPYIFTLALPGGGALLAGAQAGSVFRLLQPAERGAVDRAPAPHGGTHDLPARP